MEAGCLRRTQSMPDRAETTQATRVVGQKVLTKPAGMRKNRTHEISTRHAPPRPVDLGGYNCSDHTLNRRANGRVKRGNSPGGTAAITGWNRYRSRGVFRPEGN